MTRSLPTSAAAARNASRRRRRSPSENRGQPARSSSWTRARVPVACTLIPALLSPVALAPRLAAIDCYRRGRRRSVSSNGGNDVADTAHEHRPDDRGTAAGHVHIHEPEAHVHAVETD